MMRDAITKQTQERVVPRGDQRLPTAWVSASSARAWTDGEWLRREPRRVPPSANTPLLVMLGADSAPARAELLAHAAAGARVYVLVGPDWSKGKGQTDTQVLEAQHVLIRRLQEVPATAVYADATAWVEIGGGFTLRLDPAQAESLRLTFLRLFWHEATEETWSGGRQLEWRKAGERPFDVPAPAPTALVRWEAPDARLEAAMEGSLLHLNDQRPPDASPKRLWLPAGPSHHKQLAKLRQRDVEVSWSDRGLPDLAVTDSDGEVLLRGERGRLRIRLAAEQLPDMTRLLDEPPAWRFQVDVLLGDTNIRDAQLWLPGEGAARGLEEQQQIQVSPVRASSLRELPQTSPPSWPEAQPLALAACYHWTVLPPIMPSGASKDPLIGRWQKLDEEWSTRLKQVRDGLRDAEEERGRIKRALSRLASAVLGFEFTHGERYKLVETLEAQRPSAAGPSRAPKLFEQLKELEDAVLKLKTDQEQAEKKAREDEEREKQEAAWKSRVDKATHELSERRRERLAAEGRHGELEQEHARVEEALKTADEAERKDLEVKKLRLLNDLERVDKELLNLQGEIERLERQANAPFEFKPSSPPLISRPTQTGGRFIPAAKNARTPVNVPDEALPEVGDLYHHKGQRYLVIQMWEQLDAGEQAAARLNAKLVAPENT
jgi:hypothetical protein